MITTVTALYREAYKGLSANSWYLSLVILINRSGTMVVPFLTVYCIRRLGFDIVHAGLVMAMFGFGSVAGAFIGGKLTDRFGFYYVQVGALISGGILFIVLGFLKSFPAVCAGAFVLSMFNESFRPANSAAIAAYSEPANRTRSYSLNRLAINLGWSFGGALGGFLAAYNYQLLFWVDGLTNMGGAWLLLKLIPYKKNCQTTVGKEQAGRSAYRDRRYLVFILLTALFAVCFFQLFTIQPAFFKTEWNFDERAIGVLMAINGLIIVFFEMIVVHKLENKRHPFAYITFGLLVCASANALFNLFPPSFFTAALVVSLITFGEIFIIPFMNTYWISRSTAANRGQYAALYTIAWSVAQIVSPSCSGIIALHAGFTTLWWLTASVCMLTAFIFLLILLAGLPER